MPHRHCDVLIVGAGPAGMAAAVAAAPSGVTVTVVDDNAVPGGQIWRDGPAADVPESARHWRRSLERWPNIHLQSGTRVVALGTAPDGSGGGALVLEDAEGGWTQSYARLILCNGGRELLLPFPGWTLPGVTGAGGLQALIKAGLPVRGERIVIAGTGPLLLAAATTARRAGAKVVRIAEQAPWSDVAAFAAQLWRWPGKAWQAVTLFDRAWRAGSHVASAEGQGRVQAVRVQHGASEERLPCDRVACGFGIVPNTELGQMLGVTLNARHGLAVDNLQSTAVPGVYAAGECTGFGGSERALLQGAIAAHAAVGDVVRARTLHESLQRWEAFADRLHRHFPLTSAVRAAAQADTLVCRCEDVPLSALQNRGGWIDAKLHTRCGMGACQGRVCGAATQALFGWVPAPPRHLLAPTRLATLATPLSGAQCAAVDAAPK